MTNHDRSARADASTPSQQAAKKITRTIPTHETHGQSHHPLHGAWVSWLGRMRKKGISLPPEALDWPTFRALNPFPLAWLAGQVDAHPGLIDPAQGYTIDNIGWVTRPKRRES